MPRGRPTQNGLADPVLPPVERITVRIWWFAVTLIPFILLMIMGQLEGRNAALKAGLFAGGIFGILLVGSVYMCWHLGYIQALMSNDESGGQPQSQRQHGEGKGGEEKDEKKGVRDVEMGRIKEQQQQQRPH